MEEDNTKNRVHPFWAVISLFVTAQIGRFLLVYIFPTFIELSKGLELKNVGTALNLGIALLMILSSVEACIWLREKMTMKQTGLASALVIAWAFSGSLSIMVSWLPGLLAAPIAMVCYKFAPRSSPKNLTSFRLVATITGFCLLHHLIHEFLASHMEAVNFLSGSMGSFLGWVTLAIAIRVIWLCFALARSFTNSRESGGAVAN